MACGIVVVFGFKGCERLGIALGGLVCLFRGLGLMCRGVCVFMRGFSSRVSKIHAKWGRPPNNHTEGCLDACSLAWFARSSSCRSGQSLTSLFTALRVCGLAGSGSHAVQINTQSNRFASWNVCNRGIVRGWGGILRHLHPGILSP